MPNYSYLLASLNRKFLVVKYCCVCVKEGSYYLITVPNNILESKEGFFLMGSEKILNINT